MEDWGELVLKFPQHILSLLAVSVPRNWEDIFIWDRAFQFLYILEDDGDNPMHYETRADMIFYFILESKHFFLSKVSLKITENFILCKVNFVLM